jgi:3-hydroxy-9,10-secoandrosta-1,3,5(10)-triene-9,17-dione monooxygenase
MPDSTGTGTETTPARDALVVRAEALAPFLAGRAAETEAARTMLPDVRAALDEAGLLDILLGRHLGGMGLDIPTHLRVAAALGRGCGSTAWVQALVGYQNYLIGFYGERAQDEVRATGKKVFCSLVLGPPVVAEAADGGIVMDGRWPYVSGVDHASWLLLSARAPDALGGGKRVLTGLIPATDLARIEDDWHTMGMRGTGSKSAILERLFVPDHRVLCVREAEAAGAPGQALDDRPYFQGMPNSNLFAFVVAAPALGLAEAAFDAFMERIGGRTNARMPGSQTEWASTQAHLGRARARIDGAYAAFFAAVDRFDAQARAGRAMDAEDRGLYRMAAVQAVADCTEVVLTLFMDSGTGVVIEGHPMQRILRDALVLRSHFMLSADLAAENAGRVVLGLSPRPPFS